MRRHWKKLVLLLAGIAIASLSFALLSIDSEPSYQGRSLSEWLLTQGDSMWLLTKGTSARAHSSDRRDFYILTQSSLADASYLRSLRVQYQSAQIDALQHMGTKILPHLIGWASYEPPKWRKPLDFLCTNFPALRNNHYVQAAFYKADLRPEQARIAFGLLGTNGAPALPDLARIAANTNKPAPAQCARSCIAALLEGNPPHSNRQFVTSALHDPSPIVREEATQQWMMLSIENAIADRARASSNGTAHYSNPRVVTNITQVVTNISQDEQWLRLAIDSALDAADQARSNANPR